MNKFAKHIEKAKEQGRAVATVRRDVVRRLIEKGEYHKLIRNYSYTDDYAWDAATNFGKGEVKDTEDVTYWLERKTTCYISVDNPNEVHIIPYQGLSYSLFLEAPEEEADLEHEGNYEETSAQENEEEHAVLHVDEQACEYVGECAGKHAGSIVDFATYYKRKKEQERERKENEEFRAKFLKMFGDQPKHVQLEIAQSILDRDYDRYMKLTAPIINRRAIADFNKGDFKL